MTPFYSQKDPRWAKKKLGTCNKDTFGSSACFLTSFCNWLKLNRIMDKTPEEMNAYFIQKKLWTNGCNIDMPRISKHFGLGYQKVWSDPMAIGTPCIAETDHYKKVGVPQHFFLYRPGKRVDPLDLEPDWEENLYHIVSWRVLTAPKKEPITTTNPSGEVFEVKPEPKPEEPVKPPVASNLPRGEVFDTQTDVVDSKNPVQVKNEANSSVLATLIQLIVSFFTRKG